MLPILDNRDASRFAFVAKISLIVTLVALIAMTGVVMFITTDGGEGYLDQLANLRLSQQRLMPLVVLVGLFLLATAGFITWLIALYSSFRVAGPLYRFACNIEMVLTKGLVTLVPLRRDDCFQQQSRQLNEAVSVLKAHYTEIEQLLGEIKSLVEQGDPDSPETQRQLSELKQRLVAIDRSAEL
jgi:hypothetical protein